MTDAPVDSPLTLSELVDSKSFSDVCRSFSELFGIGIRVFDASGKKITDIRTSTGEHCGYLYAVHSTRILCTSLVQHIRTCPQDESGTIRRVDCFSGLRYQIMPLVYEGNVLGRVIFGPYAPEGLEAPPAALAKHQPALDIQQLTRLQRNIPRAPEAAVAQVLNAVGDVFEVILHATYKAALASRLHIKSVSTAFADLRKTSKSLERANARLQELDRLKSNFVATVSHELRTPLTSIIGYSEMLLEGMAGELTEDQRGYVKTVLEKGESLLLLVAQVLDLSRIESGNVVMSQKTVDPRAVVELGLSDVMPQALKRNLQVQVDLDDSVKPIVLDGDKLRRIVSNLLSNAVKFTPEGGRIWIAMDVAQAPTAMNGRFDIFEPERNEYLRLEVRDTGIGIPEDQIEQIFDSFFQVDNSSTRGFGGSGLGLTIVRNFAQAHDGRVDVSSKVGEGSTFTVLLPYHRSPPLTPSGIDGIGDHGLDPPADA